MLEAFRSSPKQQHDRLHGRAQAVQDRGAALVATYNETFAAPDVCARMRLVDTDSLRRLRRADLRTATSILGLDTGATARKDELCALVRLHYERRVELLRRVSSIVERQDRAVAQALAGDFCHDGMGAVSDAADRAACAAAGFWWAPARLLPFDHRSPYNRKYTLAVRELLNATSRSVAALDGVVDLMLRRPERVDDARVVALETSVSTADAAMRDALRRFVSHTRAVRVAAQDLPHGVEDDVQLLSDEEIQARTLEAERTRTYNREVQAQMRKAHKQLVRVQADQVKQHYSMALQ